MSYDIGIHGKIFDTLHTRMHSVSVCIQTLFVYTLHMSIHPLPQTHTSSARVSTLSPPPGHHAHALRRRPVVSRARKSIKRHKDGAARPAAR